MNIIRPINAMWPNLERACEIALVGGLTIHVFPSEKYENFKHDYPFITAFYHKVYFTDAMPHMAIELTPPELFGSIKADPLEYSMQRASECRQRYLVEKNNFTMTTTAFELLKTATARTNRKRSKMQFRSKSFAMLTD